MAVVKEITWLCIKPLFYFAVLRHRLPNSGPFKTPKSVGVRASMKKTIAEPPNHLSNLVKIKTPLTTVEGKKIDVWELKAPLTGTDLSAWAARFRQNYCSDQDIDTLREGTGLSRAKYLNDLVFPDQHNAPGPGIRAGDFAELLISDYVEFCLGYWVNRGKYSEKMSRDESVKGVDILGFRQTASPASHPTDTLVAFEVKAQLSQGKYNGRLQTAIDDSAKDYLRRATTLNAMKRRLLTQSKGDEALIIQRFQNYSDHPYLYRSGVAAVLSENAYDESLLQSSTFTDKHTNVDALELVVIRGKDLMTMVHALYETAANEA